MFPLLSLLLVSGVSFAATPSLLISTDVPKDQKSLLLADLDQLTGKSLRIEDPEFNRVMDIEGTTTGDSLLGWLSERIRYVIGENYDFDNGIEPLQMGYNFQNPGVTPDKPKTVNVPDGDPDSSGKTVVTVMTNIGGAIYVAGKRSDVLLGMNIHGIGQVPISSPRAGVLQVGQGLFMTAKGRSVKDIDESLKRLSVLFHEARHSDGNGKSLVMMHVNCPKGHDYAGYPACDFSLNGSYSVGAQVGKVLTENCTKCTAAEKESLRLEYLDSFSRVIKEQTVGGKFDIGVAAKKTLKATCDFFEKKGMQLPEACGNLNLPESSVKIVKATYLDSRPEGKVEKRRRFTEY